LNRIFDGQKKESAYLKTGQLLLSYSDEQNEEKNEEKWRASETCEMPSSEPTYKLWELKRVEETEMGRKNF